MSITRLQQTILHGEGPEAGDCFRAAVASLLGFESAEAVPHFCRRELTTDAEGADVWWRTFVRWLRQYGLTAVDIPYHPRWAMSLERCTYLLSGPSPRFPDEMHTVIAEGPHGELVHDPHPDATGIREWKNNGDWYVTLLFPLRPWEVAA